ncbi:hypothetical protein BT69DRAFT_246098 [Atractiella rhizophila]|nr:hypothetical protein BT69DRAFT_246098 [Atractiella rhizophila]
MGSTQDDSEISSEQNAFENIAEQAKDSATSSKKRKRETGNAESGSGSGKAAEKAKQKRNRIQTSCVECHRRKQACDRQVPCSRCVKRGIAHLCFVPTDPSDPNTGNSQGDITRRLLNLKKIIEAGMPEGWDLERALDSMDKGSSFIEGTEFPTTRQGTWVSETTGENGGFYVGPGSLVSLLAEGNVVAPLDQVQAIEKRQETDPTGLGIQKWVDFAKVIEALPGREVCDYLVDRFYEMEFLKWLIPVWPRSWLQAQYEQLWMWKQERLLGIQRTSSIYSRKDQR